MENEEQEMLELENLESEIADSEMDTARYKIKTYGADFTLELLSKKIDDGEIIIPKFQRRYVWNIKKASKLIESFLLGLPVPQIFLYREEESQDLLVVDGQQRLKTINYFLSGVFNHDQVFKLKGVREEWDNKAFNDLNTTDQRKLKNYILRANIFEQTDPQDNSSVFEIFERLNTGGIALTPQEIRNCVIRGNINDFLQELNSNKIWRLKILLKEHPDARMKDIEMILRFFALYENRDMYKKPMKDFISGFMQKNSTISDQEKKQYKKIFEAAVNSIAAAIDKPFRVKAGINIAILDSVMVAIATIKPENLGGLKERYDNLLRDADYLDSVSKSTTDAERVRERIETAILYIGA